ncbi:MAG: rod shape-determining protein RodA [Gammaproteobacteria bacterium]|nr:rod shape-determining protein RodA [Gammaproteobacteria bacterium]MBU2675527.1 rod shape-determining protein RodA [Gammaproteobacteria bacterium]NNC57278.1 rod shape-determining protein RodA [Woeseiaceae bacterium]NNL49262.1 rod shape-determining protein RodA [Woeseiaceae bacterium]
MPIAESKLPLTSKTEPRSDFSRLIRRLHIDGPLLGGLVLICGFGLFILYSAVGESNKLLMNQAVRLSIAFVAMLVAAQMPPDFLRRWTPWGYGAGIVLLVLVLITGEVGQGARRWLNLGVRFQPSEAMKLGVPMMAAWYLHDRQMPPRLGQLLIIAVMIVVPTILIARQPDLGTSLLIAASGIIVIILAGMSLRLIIGMGILAIPGAMVLWTVMKDYQKQRVLTLLNPDTDPLGAGYNIIQSKIAIGSGGLFGKGWTNGSQAHLEFLPERDTDFIFAVLGEEFGLFGVLTLLALYMFVIGRGLYMAVNAHDTYSRLLAGSISLTFLVYVFVNTAMVTGLIPVVGVPLPLVSFGGTSMVTLMAGFGILMSIHSQRKLLPH